MQIAERLSRLAASMSASLDMFILTAIRATHGGRSSGHLKIESAKPQGNGKEPGKTLKGCVKCAEMHTTKGATESVMMKSAQFSKSNLPAVRFAGRPSVKIAFASITATILALFAASSATSATSALPQLSGPASSQRQSHTSKDMEVGHKQAYGNKPRTGYDKIEITPKELLNSAVFNWSRVVGMFSLTGTELLFTGGDEERIDLMAFYIEAARKSVKEKWEAALVSDGTADGGRQMIGLGGSVPIIPNVGTYGGIDRANVPEWRTTTYSVPGGINGMTTWDSTTARPIIEFISAARSRGENYPDLWMFDSNSWSAVSASMVAHQRIVNPDRAGRLGYNALSYYTPAGEVELVAAVGIGNVMPANTAFGIDTKSLAIYEFPGQAFVPFHGDGGMRPINQDAVAEGIVWSGQMVLENPISTVRLQTA